MIKTLTGTPEQSDTFSQLGHEGQITQGVYEEIPSLPGVFKFRGALESGRDYTQFFAERKGAIILTAAYHGDRITQDGKIYNR